MTLTEFLLARIAEDESAVEDWPIDGPWGAHPDGGMWVDSYARPIYAPRARVLAEVEAKRRIVEDVHFDGSGDYVQPWCSTCSDDENLVDLPCQTLRLLALPYADHPDCDEEWRP